MPKAYHNSAFCITKKYTFLHPLWRGNVLFLSLKKKRTIINQPKGRFEQRRPLWKPPPPRHPIPENVPIFGYLHEAIFSFFSCKRSKIGTFLDAGWRCGGWILKEGAFARSASLSRLLLVLFLATQEKYIRSPHVQKGIPFCKLHKSNLVLFL